jgi:hypothetical protein
MPVRVVRGTVREFGPVLRQCKHTPKQGFAALHVGPHIGGPKANSSVRTTLGTALVTRGNWKGRYRTWPARSARMDCNRPTDVRSTFSLSALLWLHDRSRAE